LAPSLVTLSAAKGLDNMLSRFFAALRMTEGRQERQEETAITFGRTFPLMAPAIRRWLGRAKLALIASLLEMLVGPGLALGQEKIIRIYPPDEKTIEVRDPASLPQARLPNVPPPPTVTSPQAPSLYLGLDDAIQTTLANSQVVRVLAGVTAAASGSTIYDPAITQTTIDQAKARFDPMVNVNNTFARQNPPIAAFDPLDPTRAIIEGAPTQSYDMNLGVSKVNSLGGTASLAVDVNPTRTRDGLLPLNPQTRSSIQLSYTQPLLQGAGVRVNLAPIVIARLNTERSFFQFKDNVQQSVRGVIQAYWSLVFARTDAWARRRQVEQGEQALLRAEGRFRAGLADVSEVAQARTALANFKATLIGSQANVLNQEAALANIMKLDPATHLIPLSPPSGTRLKINWDEIVRLAGENRPDLIELKLILEADDQMLLQARNQARPQLNAVMMYRWNGLEGTMPNSSEISAFGGQFSEWTLGVNFALPIGLRQARAALRQQELILFRDQANLDQGLHNATHLLALSVRNLDQFYDQYRAYQEARVAARINLQRQLENYRRGRTILLNVLQAITDWGNAVSSEAQALTQYNTELANLEQTTGTILEAHRIRFYEERYGTLGPLGRRGRLRDYPQAMPPGPNEPKYPKSKQPGENFFNLEDPLKAKPELAPPPAVKPR
jgi:outer membrane protein TolC